MEKEWEIVQRFKRWLYQRFLPDWCREELLAENHRLAADAEQLRQENRELTACIAGMEAVLKRLPKSVTIGSGGKEGGG